MAQKVIGHLSGLSSKEIRELERFFSRNIQTSEIVSQDLARELILKADELKRKLGLLIDRNARIVSVIVGENDLLYLPDLGRLRTATGSLRKLRLVQTEFSKKAEVKIPQDVLTDLEKLRLDSVVVVKLESNQVKLSWAWLVPRESNEQATYDIQEEVFLHQLDFNYLEWIQDLEQELSSTRTKSKSNLTDRALIIGVYSKGRVNIPSRMLEMRELARTAEVEIVGEYLQQRKLDPKTLVGKGKLTEITLEALRLDANLLIFDRELTPGQWRSINTLTDLKVIDRSMLILDIFALRAKSSDGKLQVELAQLKYNLPKLTDMDSGMSRLTGGIGGRGPGETKLEVSRRYYRDRIKLLEDQIDKLGNQRELRRQKRVGKPVPLVALVGYTNVGKSSLFNALSKAEALVENKLFATLDPTQRRIFLETPEDSEAYQNGSYGQNLVLIDTVGFIRELPQELKKAFRATLEEIGNADLILHIHDASDPEIQERHQAVEQQIADAGFGDIPKVNILNKIDLTEEGELKDLIQDWSAICVSAIERTNFQELRSELYKTFSKETYQTTVKPEKEDWE